MRVLQVGSGKRRFPFASVIALFLIFGTLSVLPQTAWAAYYKVTYSGGTATWENGGSAPYSLNSNGWWAGSAAPSSSPRFNAFASCTAAITATFTWTPSYTGDITPPPTKAVVYQHTDVWTSGSGTGNGTIDNGISGATQYGRKYSIKDDPGASFSVTLSPSATRGPFSYGVAIASVKYQASAAPLEIILSGGRDFYWQKKYLIGQAVTTSLITGGLTPTSYNWTASGGDPFKNWAVTWNTSTAMSNAVLVGLGSQTNSTMSFYFKKPIPQATVTCTTHLAVPSGAVPAAGLNVTVSRNCGVEPPDNASFSAYIPQNAHQFPGDENIFQEDAPYNGVGVIPPLRFYGLDAPGYNSVGIRWDGRIRTSSANPSPWVGGDGGWNWVQKGLVYRYQVRGGQNEWSAVNGIEGLDDRYPYEPWPYFSATNSQVGTYSANYTIHTAGDSPATAFLPGTTEMQANDHFETWMMYRPPSPNTSVDDSTFVPIKKIFWQWYGLAQYINGNWTLTSSSSSWSFGDDYPNFPVWDYVISSANLNTWLHN